MLQYVCLDRMLVVAGCFVFFWLFVMHWISSEASFRILRQRNFVITIAFPLTTERQNIVVSYLSMLLSIFYVHEGSIILEIYIFVCD